ncbi:MAG: tRNA-(ms[2]io[6]A)-hydroxylase [Myxococcaceae bacterium]|nr:tRNA-(ms[2]io[6]A)-hydroxylase [Myxococcaceae bacterium]
MKLRDATSPRWLEVALGDFDATLLDHAHCEKKAAANALSLLQAYPDVPGLPAQMARLAREESAHLAKVLAVAEARGLTLSHDKGDPYAKGLQALLRNPPNERRLDRFLVAAIIEARSHERLELLANALEDPKLRTLYAELAQSEDGHQALFLRLAESLAPKAVVDARLEELLEAEGELVRRLPVRPAVH